MMDKAHTHAQLFPIPEQFGFMKGMSTKGVDFKLRVHHNLLIKNTHVKEIFCDLEKSFSVHITKLY
jgi:hypothetical protein